MYKNYIGIVRDHSASMSHLRAQALKDYNSQIVSIRNNSQKYNIDTIVSTSICGYGRTRDAKLDVVNSSVNRLENLNTYETAGCGTPLWDAVGLLIENFSKVPDFGDPEVTFLIIVITDGEENSSKIYSSSRLSTLIKIFTATDRWTFAFRVPVGYKRQLQSTLNIPEGNIVEWKQTNKGFEKVTNITNQSFDSYYSARSLGVRSTNKFFVDVNNLQEHTLKNVLNDIKKEVEFFVVPNVIEIKEFLENDKGVPYIKGQCFYSLVKTETLQPQKKIAIRDKSTGAVYVGNEARDLLNLPRDYDIKIVPSTYSAYYEVFIQSTSVNRKLMPNQTVMLWRNA